MGEEVAQEFVSSRPPDLPTAPPCCSGLYELPITSILLGDSFHPGGPALTRRLAEASMVGRKSRVLDVACGTGSSAHVIADNFGATVFGVDYSALHLKNGAPAPGPAAVPRFAAGSSTHLPFPDEFFDVVICECALCTFADKGEALDEMKRVLKPGGRLGLSDIVVNQSIPEELTGIFGHALCIAGALSHRGYIQTLERNGFTSLRSRDVSENLREMLATIEKRIGLAQQLNDAGELDLPEGFDQPEATLEIAKTFVENGGLGYSIFIAKKDR